MSEAEVDQEICEALKARKSIPELGQEFLTKILDPEASFRERQARLRFLFVSGQLSALVQVYDQAAFLGLEMPYSFLIETIGTSPRTPSKDLLDEVFSAAKSPEQIADLVTARSWDPLDARIPAAREQLFVELEVQFKDRLEQLLEKLAFYQNQRMVQEEKRLIDRLKHLYPQDSRVVFAEREFTERWARHVIAKASLDTFDSAAANVSSSAALDADQWPLANLLLDEAVRLTKEKPERGLDLTMLFWFLELYPQALIVLEIGSESPGSSWFRIEILLELRRFVDALDELKNLETKFAQDSETPFAIIYLRAQALYGLGQEAQALELMRSLVNVRPEYRSARSFISKWNSGVR